MGVSEMLLSVHATGRRLGVGSRSQPGLPIRLVGARGSHDGWGRDVRAQTARQRLRLTERPIPRFIARNAIWTDDLARVRLAMSLIPHAVLTPHGAWHAPSTILFGFGKQTVREKRSRAAWRRKIRRILGMYPAHLAIGVDYHS